MINRFNNNNFNRVNFKKREKMIETYKSPNNKRNFQENYSPKNLEYNNNFNNRIL